MLSLLGKIQQFGIFFLFLLNEKGFTFHAMQSISSEDNLHEISYPIFLKKKKKKKKISVSSAEFAPKC